MVDAVLSSSTRVNLFSIQQTQRQIAQTQERLATGNRVNSATDNPQNFFTARRLDSDARDLSRLLDGISNSINVIQSASDGIDALSSLLNQAEGIAQDSLGILNSGGIDPNLLEVELGTATPLSDIIQADNPVAYYRLNDTVGTAINLGSGGGALNGTLQGGATNGAAALYSNNATSSTEFTGGTSGIRIPDSALINTATYAQRTVELVFNADDVTTRQVLFEEGATVNGLTIYIDDGDVILTAADEGDFEDLDIRSSINAGQTYQVGFVFNQFDNSFRGFLNGVEIGSAPVAGAVFPSHGGDIGIGFAPDGVQFADGESATGGFNFDGRISDVAIYNTALTESDFAERFGSLSGGIEFRNSEFETVLSQVDSLLQDTSFSGVNLLQGSSLVTYFNPDLSSSLVTEGQQFSSDSFNIRRSNFNDANDLNAVISSVRGALREVESFSRSLSNDLNIIETRQQFTNESINAFESGADDLTLADENEEGLNLLASQTQLLLAQETLASIASNPGNNVLSLALQSRGGFGVDLRV